MQKYGWNKESRKIFGEMKRFFNNECVKCRGASNLANVERDHIIPSYQGGSNLPNNWQPLCARCNTSKGPDNTDYRIKWCVYNRKFMPKDWVA
jgi:5-methylcytosine-specific restriction endonuclease McrA